MSIECYYKDCPNHCFNFDREEGPFCDLVECIATPSQLRAYATNRAVRSMRHWVAGNKLGELVMGSDYHAEGAQTFSLKWQPEDLKIRFREECDGHFEIQLSPEDAKAALQEAILWIDLITKGS